MQHLADDFPDQIEAILKRRGSDLVFDSICADFEEIASEIAEIRSNDKTPLPPSISDLTHTLEKLRIEIEQYLKH